MDPELLKWDIGLHYQMLAATVKSRDRTMVQNFAQVIATHKYMEGFPAAEVEDFMMTIGKAVKKTMIVKPQLQEHPHRQTGRIDDLIILTIQFAVDEVEDTFEILKNSPPEQFNKNQPVESLDRSEPVRRMIRRIEDICGDSMMIGMKNGIL